MSKPALSIVIPAYNEAGRIGTTLDATRAYLDGLAERKVAPDLVAVAALDVLDGALRKCLAIRPRSLHCSIVTRRRRQWR